MKHRFHLAKAGPICKGGGVHVGSAYLVDSVGPAHATNLVILDYIAGCLNAVAGPWIIGGDFNCTPEELEKTGFLKLVDGVVHSPAASTCGLKVYDFFVVSRQLSPAVLAVVTVADCYFGPHSPVRLLLRASPRSLKVNVINAPKGFPAHLPLGPKP